MLVTETTIQRRPEAYRVNIAQTVAPQLTFLLDVERSYEEAKFQVR